MTHECPPHPMPMSYIISSTVSTFSIAPSVLGPDTKCSKNHSKPLGWKGAAPEGTEKGHRVSLRVTLGLGNGKASQFTSSKKGLSCVAASLSPCAFYRDLRP